MEGVNTSKKNLRIAVVGCLHGSLKDVYDKIKYNESITDKKVDLLICCGDFEAVRNRDDLRYKSCPEKYKHMGQFQYYYNSNTPPPYLTIFIGGNHEASNVLDENFYGGWICQNIFYLGRAGVIKYKGLRIAGLSGIYNKFDYYRGHFEVDLIKNIKSIFHVREFEIAKASHLTGDIDIFLSHDWPTGVVNKRDFPKILKIKRGWQEELYSDTLGSPASGFLLKLLKPKFWLSGHMHYTYFNQIIHNKDIRTQFIALDKTGTGKHNREFLHIFDYDLSHVTELDYNDEKIYFDPEWLAITKLFNPYIPLEEIKYDFSNFVNDKANYLNALIDNYSFNWKRKINDYHPDTNFFDDLVKYKTEFASSVEKLEWKFMTGKEQREYIINLLGIDDFHKTKKKEKKETLSEKKKINDEEIEIEF
jgi:lariat debranching enzyme